MIYFIVHIISIEEVPRVLELKARIKELYDSDLIIIDQAGHFRTEIFPNIKYGYRGEWTNRFLKLWLDRYKPTDEDVLIKIDPDTEILDKVEIPESRFFGDWRLSGNSGIPTLMGGFQGFSKIGASSLVWSKHLTDDKYSKWKFQDQIVADCIIILKQTGQSIPGVNCWANSKDGLKVFHPSKS